MVDSADGWGDQAQDWPHSASEMVYEGRLLSVRRDVLVAADGGMFDRFTVEHPGAVGVVTVDDEGRVLLLRQYRATVSRRLVQLPAGILDVAGEPPLEAARRELAEEADLRAGSWEPLLEMWPSPGITDERWHLFLARDLSGVAEEERHARTDEEADMQRLWVPIEEVLAAVRRGQVMDGMVIAAVHAARDRLDGS